MQPGGIRRLYCNVGEPFDDFDGEAVVDGDAGGCFRAIDGVELKGLRSFSVFLGKRSAGDSISIRVRRGDDEIVVEATLVAR